MTKSLPRYEVRRQDIVEQCEHQYPKFCKAKIERTNHGDQLVHYVPAWHVWDRTTNDYAHGSGPGAFPSARDAREFRNGCADDQECE